jgi:chromosomal replication initiator protein
MTLETQDPHELWAQCLLNIERQVRPQSFSNWFRPTLVNRFDEDQLIIQVPSLFFADWVENHYLGMIQLAVKEETALVPKVSFVVEQASEPEQKALNPTPASNQSHLMHKPYQAQPDPSIQTSPVEPIKTLDSPEGNANVSESAPTQPSSLNERYIFDDFVIGEGNRFAHAAALAVANSPGKTQFNPLVIYGAVGLGKTHLLQAIGHHARSLNLVQKVVYVPSEKFMSDFIESLKNRNTSEFQKSYRSVDILLVDDIQFLHQDGKQIVMTCDSPPGQLEGLEERLISRFQWGLVTPIEPPDLETRIAILHQKAERTGILLSDDVAAFLGSYISSNVRELEGGLIHLMAYCSIHKTELTIEAAKQIVQTRGPDQISDLNIEAIQQHVADHFSLTLNQLIGKGRKQDITAARHIAMFLSKRLTKNPLKMIGLHFGNRDHSTVIHAVRSVEKKCKNDPSFARIVEDLSETIRRQHAPT